MLGRDHREWREEFSAGQGTRRKLRLSRIGGDPSAVHQVRIGGSPDGRMKANVVLMGILQLIHDAQRQGLVLVGMMDSTTSMETVNVVSVSCPEKISSRSARVKSIWECLPATWIYQ